ncbi:cyclophilin [Phlyctochytrium arcticum]|nr:cyclophilin [Phlyctochytrium arcticum]
MSTSRAFLEIRIGDAKSQEVLQEAYSRTASFIAAKANELALDATAKPETLEDWQKELLLETYNADPAWKSRGPLEMNEPLELPGGRIDFSLFDKECPKTVANFVALCTGSAGLAKASKKPLHYKNTPIHRVVTNFVAQGGDITRFDGSGGDSIYGGTFNDEKAGLKIKFESKGLLAMANSGKNTNTSQFFITIGDDAQKLAKMSGKYVIFGKITSGESVLDLLAEVATDDGQPMKQVQIVDCGIY